jgi:Zn finger protein HypA/HybF involved in hydrogenase expression
VRVNLPPGCYGIQMEDGTKYDRDRSGRVEVADHHAAAIDASWYRETGVMVGTERHTIATKTGRWCATCQPARLWNRWNISCPRCGATTTEEKPS